MLKRKIEQKLIDWKNTENRKPLIIKGCRQCGKTFSVLDFAKKNYKNVVYLNFFENPDYASVFAGSLEVDTIVMMLSALLGSEAVFESGSTVLILDEIQECPEALHNRMKQLLLQYVVVGGMPDAVQTFVDTKQMDEVLQIQRDIVRSYEDDMVKYAEKKDKSRIKECFQSIPKQLSKENKKFQYSVVKKGSTASKYAGSLQWIEDAGIIVRCYNLSITELPLDGNAEEDIFKVYMRDCGLFVSMLEDGTQYDILQGNLYGYKGAIFENLIADVFGKMGRKLYYFHKDSGLEVDFVIRYKGQCTLVEVKASTGNTKSTRTILRHPEKYHVSQAIKLGDYNVERTEQLLTLPLYMAFLLKEL